MRVGEVMTRDVATVPAGESLVKAAETMRSWNVGFLPVMENNLVVGVVTDRDLTLRGIGENRNPQKTAVRDVMTGIVLWCYEDEVLTEAAKIMEENHVRRLVVLDGRKRLAGLLSLNDLGARMSSDRLFRDTLRNVTVLG